MSQDTKVKQLIVNQLSKEQYKQAKLDNILSNTELYIITDDYHYTEQEIQSILSTKQDKLTTSGKINIDENNVISVDLSDYDSTLGSGLEYENSVLTLVSKDGKVLSNVTIKSTPDVDDTTIHLNNGEQLEVIGNVTKDGTTKYDWIGTKEEYEQGLTSGLITNTTTCFITDDEQDLITGGDILIPTKLSQFANDTNFVNSEILNNSIATKVDKVEGKSLIDDAEIVRLSGVNNYNDTEIKQILNNKVDKIDGKSLIDDTEIVRLSGINNYDDTSIVNNITSLQLNKSNTSLNNLTPEGEKHFLNKSQITNCITEIPQDIKLELKDGVLTLKAGSKVYVPNGFEADGTTPKFDEVVIESDYSQKSTYNASCLCFCNLEGGLANHGSNISFSGNTQPTSGQVWYNTATNKILTSSDNGQTWIERRYTLPIASTTATTNGFTSIDQTFNGFGYIGSTVYVLPNVKGLIPNGRNEDRTLKSVEVTTTKVIINTIDVNWSSQDWFISSNGGLNWYPLQHGKVVYNEEANLWVNNEQGGINFWFPVGKTHSTGGKITSFTPKQPFRAIDYSDKSTVSGWSMPSNKFINLSVGASGTIYTAPANGYFAFGTTTTATANNFTYLANETTNMCFYAMANAGVVARGFVPVRRGDIVSLGYFSSIINSFIFVYADG